MEGSFEGRYDCEIPGLNLKFNNQRISSCLVFPNLPGIIAEKLKNKKPFEMRK
jgi:hypothetical protein